MLVFKKEYYLFVSKSGTERNVIGLYNWDLTPQKIECKIAWIGLKDKSDYYAFDFWENKPINDISSVVSEELLNPVRL